MPCVELGMTSIAADHSASCTVLWDGGHGGVFLKEGEELDGLGRRRSLVRCDGAVKLVERDDIGEEDGKERVPPPLFCRRS